MSNVKKNDQYILHIIVIKNSLTVIVKDNNDKEMVYLHVYTINRLLFII